MAKFDYDAVVSNRANVSGGESSGQRVSYFSLANDGDSAIVRFLCDSTKDFDCCFVHSVNVGGTWRKINCIRDAHSPVADCPLCASGQKLQQRIYVHLIEYTKDENGKIVATPKVWDRPIGFANTLKNYIGEYGPLSENVFRVKRNGVKGSMDTTYEVMYLNPNVYTEAVYTKDCASAFDTYNVVGRAVLNKTYDELAHFVATKEFPTTPATNTATATNTYSESVEVTVAEPQRTFTYDYSDVPFEVGPTPIPTPTSTTGEGVARPVRYYN